MSKIGIIGDEPHLKGYVKALTDRGHTVRLLGGSPLYPLPANLDVIVCRPSSCSHNGFDVAMKSKRAGRNVVVSNNLTDTIKQVEETVMARQPKAVVEAKLSDIKLPDLNVLTATEYATYMVKVLGVYGALLHESENARDFMIELIKQRFPLQNKTQQELLVFWEESLSRFQRNTIRVSCRRIEVDRSIEGVLCHRVFFPTRSGIQSTPVLYRKDFDLNILGRWALAALTEVQAKAKFALTEVKESKVVDTKVEVTPVSIVALPPAPDPRPAPLPVVPSNVTAAPSTPAVPPSWDTQLRVALGLVIAEMKTAKVRSVRIDQTGKVSFVREIVVVQLEDGSMDVDAAE